VVMGDKAIESMSTTDLAMWLQSKGFGVDVQEAIEGNTVC